MYFTIILCVHIHVGIKRYLCTLKFITKLVNALFSQKQVTPVVNSRVVYPGPNLNLIKF